MFRIIKTIQEIFQEKKKTASQSYISGFGDCMELLKIGFAQTSFINSSWENQRLKRILLELLESENRLSKSQLSKINDLFLLYTDDCIVIDKLYNQLCRNQPDNQSQLTIENTELNLKCFLLKEVILKLINHKFNLSQAQKKHLLNILQEHVLHSSKIDDIVNYIIDIDIENRWPDHHQIERENQELRQQIDIKNAMLLKCKEGVKLKNSEIKKYTETLETIIAVYKNTTKELRIQVQDNHSLVSKTKAMQEKINILEANKAELTFMRNRIGLMSNIIEEKNKLFKSSKDVSNDTKGDTITELLPVQNQDIKQNNINEMPPAMPDKNAVESIRKENDALKEIVSTLVGQPLSRYDRYNLKDILKDKRSPVSPHTALLNYLRRNRESSVFKSYQLSESDKTDIKKILSGTNTQESYQELYNYISYLCNEDRKGENKGKPRKGKKYR